MSWAFAGCPGDGAPISGQSSSWPAARQVVDVMVFLVLTRAGYEELRGITRQVPSPLWAGDGVLSEQEIPALYADGVTVSNFHYAIDPLDASAVEGALYTIAQHHPGQTIWVERETSAWFRVTAKGAQLFEDETR